MTAKIARSGRLLTHFESVRSVYWLFVVLVVLAPGRWISNTVASGQGSAEDHPVSAVEHPVPAEPTAADGPRYRVSEFVLVFAEDHPGHPPVEHLVNVEVELGMTAMGYVRPREGVPSASILIGDSSQFVVEWFYGSAINTVMQVVVSELNRIGLVGVNVMPDVGEIDGDGNDLRSPEQTFLTLLIRTGVVAQLRTLASGERIPIEQRVDNPAHTWIKLKSPVQPSNPEDAVRNDLLRKDVLDDYVAWLNRHPGRRVDVAISPGDDNGTAALDYLIAENKPWLAYFQVSNTGTEETDKWRERFGLTHNQLTGNDDIFSIDYITVSFDESHSLAASYEAPVFDVEWLRWRIYGTAGEFTASEVGAADEELSGEEWTVGGELIANIIQYRQLFVDLIAGVRWWDIFVDNETVGQKAREDFFLPHVGLQLQRVTDTATTQAALSFEWNQTNVVDQDADDMVILGRLNPDEDWVVMNWDFRQSVYLEPLLNREAWENTSTPASSTLAHELAISFKGQYSFDDRLIPQAERTVGGLYTVRGYEESVAAGDTALIFSGEYQFHLPRTLDIQADPSQSPYLFGKPFRYAPQHVYGQADWDLIFRGFVDVGRAINSDRESFELNETLIGAGAGLEFLFKSNLILRADWAVALEEAGDVNDGSNRFHIVITVLY